VRLPFDQGLNTYVDAIRWIERNGYDMSYESDIDVDENPASVSTHHVLISLGHDEYWSPNMRTAFDHARDHGHSLIFLGANAVYWKVAFVRNAQGMADRVLICERFGATGLWRETAPENALVGIMFSDYVYSGNGYPWQVAAHARSPLLEHTGLIPGKSYGCDLVGYEWDQEFLNGAQPRGLVRLGHSPTTDFAGSPGYSDTTYYYARSGALVFASGSIYFARAHDPFRLFPWGTCNPRAEVIPGISQLMQNVMAATVAALDSP
jgi:hypothetical protein